MEQALEGGEYVHRVKPGRKPKVAAIESPVVADEVVIFENGPGQSLAMRIWEGQSPDLGVIDRVARIASGLKAQGFSLDVTLPHPDASRYMEAHK